MKFTLLLMVLLVYFLAACGGIMPQVPTPTPTATETQTPLPTNTATATASPTPTPVPPTPTAIPLPPVPEEYLPYTIGYLRNHSYGGGQIESLEVMAERESFTRHMIRYPSDGLDIYGYVNVPKGEGPFPVIIILHGYGTSNIPAVTGPETSVSDFLTENGYLVLRSNMRGYPPSDDGDELYRVGLAVDILNLIALVKEGAGRPGLLEKADLTRIGLWGQSLGGGVALKVATVSEDIKAMVLYSAISGDELKNAELFYAISEEQIYLSEMDTPPDVMAYLSPLNYFDKIKASVKLYHSLDDDVVPAAWAIENCDEMKAHAVDIDCFYYIGADHSFSSGFLTDFRDTMLTFFETKLKGP
jgi:dipeptidyl aminopeptidase/acylaminoacyl peptidase